MRIEVLGPGCPKCHGAAENVREALVELGRSAEVVSVTDINEMIRKGVMMTPAVIVDGRIAVQGKMPTVDQMKAILKKEQEA